MWHFSKRFVGLIALLIALGACLVMFTLYNSVSKSEPQMMSTIQTTYELSSHHLNQIHSLQSSQPKPNRIEPSVLQTSKAQRRIPPIPIPHSSGHNKILLHNSNTKTLPVVKPDLHPWVRIYNMKTSSSNSYECVPLVTIGRKCRICIYPEKEDKWVSGAIKFHGIWEAVETFVFQTALRKHPDMNVVDLGGNIGLYTLLGANLGRKVLTVEPLLENAKHVHKSVELNGFQGRVTFVMNGLSDNRTVMGFKKHVGNVGGTSLIGASQNHSQLIEGVTMTTTILLDDLVPIFSSQKLFLKMDLEANEIKTIRGGHKFFQKNDIRYVLLEWHAIKRLADIKSLIDFFIAYGLEPFDCKSGIKLDVEHFLSWNDSVLWIRS